MKFWYFIVKEYGKEQKLDNELQALLLVNFSKMNLNKTNITFKKE